MAERLYLGESGLLLSHPGIEIDADALGEEKEEHEEEGEDKNENAVTVREECVQWNGAITSDDTGAPYGTSSC